MKRNLLLPIGIDNFRKLRENGFYYVDKTALIEQLVDSWGEVNLYTRPRRFGKSLNMSMLYEFFRIGANKELFDGLYISANKELCHTYLGRFPTIFVSLKDVGRISFDNATYCLKEVIAKEAEKFSFLLESPRLTTSQKETYKAIISVKNGEYTMSDRILSSSLNVLSELLYRHYERNCILFIDEYDVPLDKAFQYGYYDEMVDLIRELFGKALKSNPYLKAAVLTGCLRITKESIFTGLNNFKILSITDERFDEEFGFTEQEVKKILSDYGVSDHLQEIKEWYDGYRFGDADIYCPWDVMNHVDYLIQNPRATPQAYWINSSGNDLVRRFIDKADKTTKDEIERLMQGGTIKKKLHLELTYNELDDNIDNLWSVLFTTGYLTMVGKPMDGVYTLKIPNNEIKIVFKEKIHAWFSQLIKADTPHLQSFWRALATGESQVVEKILHMLLNKTISVLDPKGPKHEKEQFYHAFLDGVLVGNSHWGILSNRETGDGFADILVEAENPDLGMVIELKSVDTLQELEPACRDAIAQIETKRYDTYLHNEGRGEIWAYGIAFFKKRCKVMAKRLANQSCQ